MKCNGVCMPFSQQQILATGKDMRLEMVVILFLAIRASHTTPKKRPKPDQSRGKNEIEETPSQKAEKRKTAGKENPVRDICT